METVVKAIPTSAPAGSSSVGIFRNCCQEPSCETSEIRRERHPYTRLPLDLDEESLLLSMVCHDIPPVTF